jgi:hypothetical protein
VLAALSCVDCIAVFDEDSPRRLLDVARPDVYVKGGDYTPEMLPETPIVRRLGGEVRILGYLADHSSSRIIERIRGQPRCPPGRTAGRRRRDRRRRADPDPEPAVRARGHLGRAGRAAGRRPPGAVLCHRQRPVGRPPAWADPSVQAMARVLRQRGVAVRTCRCLPRRGMAEHRAFLLGQAHAPRVLFLDDDIWLEPGALDRLLAAISALRCGFVGMAVQGLACPTRTTAGRRSGEATRSGPAGGSALSGCGGAVRGASH